MTKKYKSNSLNLKEQEKLLSVIDNFEDLTLLKLALSTGIRREDITNIDIGNIDLENETLKFWEGKKKRWHIVPLLKDTLITLKRYINTKKNKKKLFDFTGRTAYNRLQKYLKKAGIKKKIAFHDLRRSFIKTAKKQGISIKAVSQITGDTYSTIQRYYSNLDMEELKEEINKL